MGFSQELQDFSEGFASGFKMVRSRDEREADRLALEQAKIDLKKGEYETSPGYLEQTTRGRELDITGKQAEIDRAREDLKTVQHTNSPQQRALADEVTRSNIAAQEAATRANLATAAAAEAESTPRRQEAAAKKAEADAELQAANARKAESEAAALAAGVTKEAIELARRGQLADIEGKEEETEGKKEERRGKALENEEKQLFLDIFKQRAQGKQKVLEGFGLEPSVVETPAVPAETGKPAPDPDADVGVEPAKPLSAVEVPGGITSSYSPPAVDVGPEAPAETPAEPRPKPRGVTAGPQPHPHVDEQQSRANIRKQPLHASTVNVLEYAGAQTGIRAVVFSGGQPHKGEEGPRTGSTRHDGGLAADVRLYDAKDGHLLNMNNPEDAARMRAFGAKAVQAGATGIGAGEDYMGASSMHIGFGNEASWGGAPWIEDARQEGLATRGEMPEPGGAATEGEIAEMFPSGSVHKSARDAAKAGLEYAIDSYGLNMDYAVGTPESDQAAEAFVSGEGAAEPEQVEFAEDVVQEIAAEAGFVINDSELPMYTLAAVYEAYIGVGKPEEAKKAASAVVQHYQKLFAQYGAIAKAAASQGDIDGAVEAAARAYAQVPDGYDVAFNNTGDGRYEVVMTNQETGEITNRALLTPEEIGGLAMEINPGNFVQFMAQAAGMEADKELITGAEAEAMGVPEYEGLSTAKAGIAQRAATERRLAGTTTETDDTGAVTVTSGGKATGKPKVLTPEQAGQVNIQVEEGLTRWAQGNMSPDGNPTPLSDMVMRSVGEGGGAALSEEGNIMQDVVPIANQIAKDNYGRVEPDLVAEGVMRMVDQHPVAAKVLPDDQTIEVKLEGIPAFTVNKELYYTLSAIRTQRDVEAGATGSARQRGELNVGPLDGFVPTYDPTRNPMVQAFTPAPGAEAVPTTPARPIVQAHPAVGGPVEIPDILLHESVRTGEARRSSPYVKPKTPKLSKPRRGGGGGGSRSQGQIPLT